MRPALVVDDDLVFGEARVVGADGEGVVEVDPPVAVGRRAHARGGVRRDDRPERRLGVLQVGDEPFDRVVLAFQCDQEVGHPAEQRRRPDRLGQRLGAERPAFAHDRTMDKGVGVVTGRPPLNRACR